jgi:hypothetical protein
MKKKTLSAKILTKQLSDTVAKDVALRGMKIEGGIAVRRGQIKGKKDK